MFLISEDCRRRRGRPRLRPDSETVQLMLDAAEQAFQAKGYAGANMLGVARHAGVSTKTMYRLIPTKADLFREVISRRIGRFMLAFSVDAHDLAGLRQALTALLIAYGELSLSEEAVAIHALVLSECRRFPELAELFNAEAISGTGRAMTSWLTRHCERGLLRLEDAGQAADMLRGMMAMEPQRAILLGRRGTLDARELAERARRCADLFLDGCAA